MHNFYLTDFIRKLFFGKSGTGRILLTVIVFFLNLGLVAGIDFSLIHNIPLPEVQISSNLIPNYYYPDFSDALNGQALDASLGFDDAIFVLYQSPDENIYVTKLKGSGLFQRYHWDRAFHILIPADHDPYSYEEGNSVNFLRFTVSGNGFTEFDHREISLFGSSGNAESKLLGLWLGIAAALLLLELFIFNKFHSLFR